MSQGRAKATLGLQWRGSSFSHRPLRILVVHTSAHQQETYAIYTCILLCLVAQCPSRCQVGSRKWHTPDLGCEEPKSLSEGQLSHHAEEIGQLCGSCILLVGLLVRVTWQGRAACLHSLGLGGLSGSTPLVATISRPGPTGGPSPEPLCLGGHHGSHPDATGPAPAQRVAARIED